MNENELQEKWYLKKLGKAKTNLVAIAVIVVVVALALGLLCLHFYSSGKDAASEKSAAKIAELEEKILKLEEERSKWINIDAEISIDIINTEIKEIGELATMEYFYTTASKFTDAKKLFGKDVGITEKSVIVKWDGVIKAGIEVDGISAALDEAAKRIEVTIPSATILSHEIDENSFEKLDEKNGLFNRVKVEDGFKVQKDTKDEMEERAVGNGLLEKAEKNAQDIIDQMIRNMPGVTEEYDIEVAVD